MNGSESWILELSWAKQVYSGSLWVRAVLGKHACSLGLCWAMASWRLLLYQSLALPTSLNVPRCPRFSNRPAMLYRTSSLD